MLINVSKEELEIIKAALTWAISFLENKESLASLNHFLSNIEKELEKAL